MIWLRYGENLKLVRVGKKWGAEIYKKKRGQENYKICRCLTVAGVAHPSFQPSMYEKKSD